MRRHLIRGALGTGGLGVLQRGLGLLTTIVIARNLGVDGYGYFAFAMAAVSVIATPTQLGLPQLLTREVATSHTRGDWSLMRGTRRRAVQLAVIAVVLSLTVIGGGLLFVPVEIAALDPETFVFALALLPLIAAIAITNSLMTGLRLVIHASWPGSVLQPLTFLLVLLALIAWLPPLKPPMAVGANIVAYAVALIVATYLLKRHWPKEASNAKPDYRRGTWTRRMVPFAMLAGINLINQKTGVMLLGIMTTAEDVGIYNVALQGSLVVSFALIASNAVIAPNVARLYAQKAQHHLQRLLTMSTAGVSVVAGAAAFVLIVWGHEILDLLFGGPFVRSYLSLCILVIGQLINVAMGSVGLFLVMTGHETDAVRALVVSAVVNLSLNVVLIPQFGIAGAASATAVSVVLWNVILAIQLYRRLHLVPGPINFRSLRLKRISKQR